MKAPEVHTEPLGGSPLAQHFLAANLPPGWYLDRPASADGWRAHAERVRSSIDSASSLQALWPAIAAKDVAGMRLERVAAERGLVVTTGQQPGLFGGPIYTWAKALSALALANELEETLGLPVAPVFWAATDDADFAEASATTIAVPGGAETIRLPNQPPPGTPMSHVPLGDISALFDVLAQGAGSASFGEALALARTAYLPGQTVGGAYVTLLRGILEPLGVSVLDASHHAVHEGAAPILRRALQGARPVAEALARRTDEIERAGYQPQVPFVGHLSLVFSLENRGKTRVPLDRANQVAAAASDEALSPNVLLRPIVERALLPSVTYVGGPAEIGYFAQVSAVAAALQLPIPMVVPRWSGMIVQPHIRRILDRYGLAADDLRDPHFAETALARARLPHSVRQALDSLRESIDRASAAMASAGAGDALPLLPSRVIEGHRRGLQQRVERLERRYLAAVKRSSEQTRLDLATARGALFPGGVRQERALNLLPILARHGPALLESMEAQARLHARTLSGAGSADTAIRA